MPQNRGGANFFENLFAQLQKIKIVITGQVVGLKHFVKGGNLIVMNSGGAAPGKIRSGA
jgi:hypothetical protein